MSEKFTPGPWELTHPGPLLHGKRVFAGTKYIGIIDNSDMDVAEIDANAHLIAAAPDMYEAVKKMCNNALDLGYCHMTDCGNCKSMAAIKKAMGES